MSIRFTVSLEPKAMASLEEAMAEIQRRQPTLSSALLAEMLTLRQLQNGPSVPEIARSTNLAAQTVRRLDRIARPNAPQPGYKSAFISYGGPDKDFAKRMYEALLEKGVHVFYFPESATPGSKLHRTMHEAVHEYDVIILVCSRNAVERPGWLNELEQTLTREAAEGGAELLVPVLLDDFVLTEWRPDRIDLAKQVRSRVAADFRNTKDDADFDKQLLKLLRALKRPTIAVSDRGDR